MNQFYLFVSLVALIGAASGGVFANDEKSANQIIEEIEEQYSYAPASSTDGSAPEKEVTNPEHLYFKDFCLQSDDVFKTYLHEKVGGTAAQIYNVLLTSVGSVGKEVIKAHEDTTAQGTKLIGTAGSDQTLAQKMLQALKMVLDSLLGSAQTSLFQRIAALRETYSLETLRDNLEDACLSISGDLQRRLDYKLGETKSSLKRASAKSPNGKELVQIAQKARTDSVGCNLTNRIAKVSKFCDVLKLAGPSIWSAMGIQS